MVSPNNNEPSETEKLFEKYAAWLKATLDFYQYLAELRRAIPEMKAASEVPIQAVKTALLFDIHNPIRNRTSVMVESQ